MPRLPCFLRWTNVVWPRYERSDPSLLATPNPRPQTQLPSTLYLSNPSPQRMAQHPPPPVAGWGRLAGARALLARSGVRTEAPVATAARSSRGAVAAGTANTGTAAASRAAAKAGRVVGAADEEQRDQCKRISVSFHPALGARNKGQRLMPSSLANAYAFLKRRRTMWMKERGRSLRDCATIHQSCSCR